MPAPSSSVISNSTELKTFLSGNWAGSTIYLDLEGRDLSRHGTLTIATVLIHPENLLGVFDLLSLREAAFSTEAENGRSLKSVLESPKIPKGVWDVRNDANALWSLLEYSRP